ncbi:XapX domain-containing protein [Bacillus taeanensis]|uniref:XapX domain-containing protein n=1 Tax=Bacillus taeanensis TaxID=273032 RepID=A0A366XSZ8_9BACI|nr:DUF1427 family protein [Bacillus taeanensis]RBW68678.1 XapX domain-containing protein [Bacillus taeanensis]
MKEILLALLAGLIVGFIFAFLKLPIPAPPVLSGIMGIFGVYLGYQIFQWLAPLFSSSP